MPSEDAPNTQENALIDYLDAHAVPAELEGGFYPTGPTSGPSMEDPTCLPAPPGFLYATWHDIPIWDVKALKVGDVFGQWMFLEASPDWERVRLTLTKKSDDDEIEPVEVPTSEIWTTLTGLYGGDAWTVRRMFASDRVVLVPIGNTGAYDAAGFSTA